MSIHQISVFLENRSGQLAQITQLLAQNGVDLRAISIAETADYGLARMIVNDAHKASAILLEHGDILSMTPVWAVEVPDRPSGLADLLDGVFISEEIGIEKPGIGFFQRVWEKIGHFAPDEVMIVGDSLTSDIQGGNNAGIICCWFNPQGKPAPEHLRIDHTIGHLTQVLDIL